MAQRVVCRHGEALVEEAIDQDPPVRLLLRSRQGRPGELDDVRRARARLALASPPTWCTRSSSVYLSGGNRRLHERQGYDTANRID
jgi:hypothetical protein